LIFLVGIAALDADHTLPSLKRSAVSIESLARAEFGISIMARCATPIA
jgi:hypothetical protein